MILAYALSFMIAMQLIEWIVGLWSSMCAGKMVSWLDCWFADQLIIRAGLSLDSEVAVISGPSGVGKTTLLRGICRHNQLLNPRLVFQEPTLLPWLSVTDNLRAVCREEGLQKHWLDLFDLPQVGALRPGQLSLGMQRRISIIRGWVDEPSASLDPENIERLITNIRVASRESSIPILVVTHNPIDFNDLEPSYYQLVGRLPSGRHYHWGIQIEQIILDPASTVRSIGDLLTRHDFANLRDFIRRNHK